MIENGVDKEVRGHLILACENDSLTPADWKWLAGLAGVIVSDDAADTPLVFDDPADLVRGI